MRVLGAALGILLCPLALAAASELSELRDLVNNDRMEEAYALASKNLDEHAGDAQFDLYYGIAALETGRLDEAIFAFERILIERPRLSRARIELARAYFLQEQDLKARKQFEIVLSGDPPPSVVDRIERYLAAIDRRSDRYELNLSGYVELGAGRDNNVNRVSEETTTVEIFGAPFELGAESEPESDNFADATGAVNVSWPIQPGLNVTAGVSGDLRRHGERSEFDRSRVNARTGLRYRQDIHRWTTTIQQGRFYVGGDRFVDTFRFDVGYRMSLDRRTGVHSRLSVASLRYAEQDQRNADRLWIGGGMSKAWTSAWNPRGQFTIQGGREAAHQDTRVARSQAERDLGRITGQFSLDPASNWTVRTSLNLTVSRYESAGGVLGEDVFPPEAREEETYGLDIALDWTPAVGWKLGPYVSYSERDSNVDTFTFQRTAAGVRARYSFY